jgi:hypothetical protein
MRVGLDFDNTIVSYDSLFHKIAREGGWIPQDLPRSKLLVRDHLRKIGKEEIWTEMQGLVYGARMAEAESFPGVANFMRWARGEGIELFIVSHKTRHPFLGPAYDLHAAARAWIENSLRDERGPLIESANVYFELTKEEKCARLKALGCGYFVDDLPELLTAPEFPRSVEPLLFDPDGHHIATGLQSVKSWAELQDLIASKWQQSPQ